MVPINGETQHESQTVGIDQISPGDGCGIKEYADGAVGYDGTTPLVHARKGTLRLGLDLLFGVHLPA